MRYGSTHILRSGEFKTQGEHNFYSLPEPCYIQSRSPWMFPSSRFPGGPTSMGLPKPPMAWQHRAVSALHKGAVSHPHSDRAAGNRTEPKVEGETLPTCKGGAGMGQRLSPASLTKWEHSAPFQPSKWMKSTTVCINISQKKPWRQLEGYCFIQYRPCFQIQILHLAETLLCFMSYVALFVMFKFVQEV